VDVCKPPCYDVDFPQSARLSARCDAGTRAVVNPQVSVNKVVKHPHLAAAKAKVLAAVHTVTDAKPVSFCPDRAGCKDEEHHGMERW